MEVGRMKKELNFNTSNVEVPLILKIQNSLQQ